MTSDRCSNVTKIDRPSVIPRFDYDAEGASAQQCKSKELPKVGYLTMDNLPKKRKILTS